MSEFKNIKRVLIANRGEIACRIIKTCKKYSLTSVCIYSKEDIQSLHVNEADEVVLLPGVGSAAYVDIDAIVKIAAEKEIDAVIPGYGFLSENSEFAKRLSELEIVFAGPSSETVLNFGLKHMARSIALKSGVPVVPGTDLISDVTELKAECQRIGYPVILKATAGGGGMGLKVCHTVEELEKNFAEVTSRGASLFSNDGVFVEKYISKGRHIEVQLFGNGLGDIVTFGERECSLQRRHQKVIEESPSPFVENFKSHDLRKKLTQCAKRLGTAVNYKSAGTVEFLVDDETGDFFFLEVNTRLQVEHGITELVYNVDLVYLMLLQADYEKVSTGIPPQKIKGSLEFDAQNVEIPSGHAIEVRLYSENPIRQFSPSSGIIQNAYIPNDGTYEDYKVRIDHWISTGLDISPYFDPLLAKVMVWSPTRTSKNMINVLNEIKIEGPTNNKEYCIKILQSKNFIAGETLTSTLSNFKFEASLLEFKSGGAYTTIQDLPGRATVRNGVPVSGPVDAISLKIANILVGNYEDTEALEITSKGPKILFHTCAKIALAGGSFDFKLNSESDIPMFTEVSIPAGSIVEIGDAKGESCRCYLAIKGGFPEVATYLGSKSCTPGLKLGGYQGRILARGDCLSINPAERVDSVHLGYVLPESLRPNYEEKDRVIRMVGGPHDSHDIVSEEALKVLYSSDYHVNFNSNRGGIRLDGPSLQFSRKSGGDGGGHPSNILEYPYPTCGLSAVGSSMVLFGVDGATLSGFICVSVPIQADFWKFGQAKVNSKITFQKITYDDAIRLRRKREEYFEVLRQKPQSTILAFDDGLERYEVVQKLVGQMLHERKKGRSALPYVSFRQAGEDMIVIDFGTERFDLMNNGRQHMLQSKIEQQLLGKFTSVECCSGAMCVTFDPLSINQQDILSTLVWMEESIPAIEGLKVPSRTFKLPVCFDHSSLNKCIERYMSTQRSHATYLPKNTDYLMEANCIDCEDEFKKCIIGKEHIVVAVSFLCANPLLVNTDPRSRFVTSKYNPARTSTPAGTIGSGSVSHSVYSVESPGGYMVWGVTLPNWYWDTFSRIHENPWPLNNFDQIVFYEVDESTLDQMNNDILAKRLVIEAEESEFDFVRYKSFLGSIKDEYEELALKKKEAFEKLIQKEELDLEKWQLELLNAKESKKDVEDLMADPENIRVISEISASVFKIHKKKGIFVKGDESFLVLEAMKMEINVIINESNDTHSENTSSYEILEIYVDEGDIVNPGDILAIARKITP